MLTLKFNKIKIETTNESAFLDFMESSMMNHTAVVLENQNGNKSTNKTWKVQKTKIDAFSKETTAEIKISIVKQK